MTSQNTESSLGRTYRNIYEALCGKHPHVRPWHFQWLGARLLQKRLRILLPTIAVGTEIHVLDVGCANKPYRAWFGPVAEYVGLDVVAGPEVDVVAKSSEKWRLPDAQFDIVLCTQVLEHVEDLEHFLAEIQRVLKPGGVIVASFPFIYNEHGIPWDYRRFSAYGAEKLFLDMHLLMLERQGGIGSTTAILLLNWWEDTLNLNFPLRLLKAILLPLNLVAATILNMFALLLDQLDRTGRFYGNILVVVEKPKTASWEDLH